VSTPERSLGELAVARDHVGGRTPVRDEHSHSPSRCDASSPGLRPAMAAAARRAASVRRHPPRPTPPATRSTARRAGRVPSLGGRRGRARAASATDSGVGTGAMPSPRPRRRCASDQRRSSGTRHRRAGRALVMGDDDLDLTTSATIADDHRLSPGLSRATARLTASRCPAASARHRPLTGRALPRPAGPRHVDREVQAACRRGR